MWYHTSKTGQMRTAKGRHNYGRKIFEIDKCVQIREIKIIFRRRSRRKMGQGEWLIMPSLEILFEGRV